MNLFDDIVRSDDSQKRQGESLFRFYNRTSRRAFQPYRDLVHKWLNEMPPSAAVALTGQMRTDDDLHYSTGLCELVTHASLRRLGFDVEVHPVLKSNANRPDFCVTTDGQKLAYVEVTTINPPRDEIASDRREAQIYDRLNQLSIPDDLRLGYDVLVYGLSSPSLARLAAEAGRWVLANADAARRKEEVQGVFEAGDWKIQLHLFGGFRARAGGPRIAISSGEAFSRDIFEAGNTLAAAANRKATRYGDLDLPFVIVLFDRTETVAIMSSDFAESVADGLFGPEITEHVAHRDGGFELRRRRGDGFWVRGGRPDHTGVSAVVTFPRDDIWKLREARWQPIMARNPYAKRPLPNGILPYRELVINQDEGQILPGRSAGDILDLPNPWPPADD